MPFYHWKLYLVSVTDIFQGKFSMLNVHGMSNRSLEVTMTFNVVSCNGVLMFKVQDPIMILHLVFVCNDKGKVVFVLVT